MRITRIFAEKIKIYPKLDLSLEGYKITLITGSNGAGKTTAFVSIPMISFFSELAGRSIRDYALPQMESKIGTEFEYDGNRYGITRQYAGDSPESVFRNFSENTKVTKARAIEAEVEKLFGMDRETFLNTVVIAQGEVETLSERPPKERRELFLRFLGVDFKKAYDKAKDELENVLKEIEVTDSLVKQLSSDLEEKGTLEEKMPKIKTEIKELESVLGSKKNEKEKVIDTRNQLMKELLRLREQIGQMEPLTKRKNTLKIETEEFSRRMADLKKENLMKKISELDLTINIIQDTYPLLERKNKLVENLSILEEIKGIGQKHEDPEELEKKIRKLEEHEKEIEKERNKIKSDKIEFETKIKATSLYVSNIEKESKCPICDTQLSGKHKEEVIGKIQAEIEVFPEKVQEMEKRLQEIEEEMIENKRQVKFMSSRHGESKNAFLQIEIYTKKLDKEYATDPEASIAQISSEIENLNIKLETNTRALKIDHPLKIDNASLMKIQRTLTKEREVSQKLHDEYGDFGRKLEEIKHIEEDLKLLEPLNQKIDELNIQIGKVEEKVKELEENIRELSTSIGSKKEELKNTTDRLFELQEKEKLLKKKKEHFQELVRKKEVFYIVKENVFKNSAFPTVYLREFVQIVQSNLSDFISKFKGGRYEIDIGITDDGDIEVRARDRSKKESSYRPLKTFSQGERTIIGFAVRLATMRAISQYKGKNMPNILIIDEGFGPLDQENIKALVDGIKELGSIFEQIFIISHIEQLKEDFDQKLVVEETENGSIVRSV